jgi:uncharacterized Zn finger protein (UPF0148 family)
MGEIQIPLDSQGYLRRQCPNCEREFKWHHGPTEEMPEDAPEPNEYFCPYCGAAAALDQWWTQEQVEALQTEALREAMPAVDKALREAMKPLDKSGFIRTEIKSNPVNPATPLFEPEDMVGVASPCHSYEPLKILEGWEDPIHCLICGQPFTV